MGSVGWNYCCSESDDRDGDGPVRRGAVAKLAVGVIAPTLNLATRRQVASRQLSTSVVYTGGNKVGICDAPNWHWHGAVRMGAVTELTVAVVD